MENIGALWLRESKKTGKKYMSGKITVDGKEVKIMIFRNDNKKTDKHPDYQIVESEPIKKPVNEDMPF